MSANNQRALTNIIMDFNAQPNALDTRAQILAAYLQIAVHEGLSELTLTRVADEVGLSKQLVRYHVHDLNGAAIELFQITAKIGARYTQDRIDLHRTPEAKLKAWAEATFDWVKTYDDFARFLLVMYHRSSVDEAVKKIHRQILFVGRDRVRTILASFSKRSVHTKADFLAQIIHLQMIASVIQMLSLNDFASLNKYKKEFMAFLNYTLPD